jgi:hypothetical protein
LIQTTEQMCYSVERGMFPDILVSYILEYF